MVVAVQYHTEQGDSALYEYVKEKGVCDYWFNLLNHIHVSTTNFVFHYFFPQ